MKWNGNRVEDAFHFIELSKAVHFIEWSETECFTPGLPRIVKIMQLSVVCCYSHEICQLIDLPTHMLYLLCTQKVLISPVENQNNLELDFKVFFFADSCCSDIVVDESD